MPKKNLFNNLKDYNNELEKVLEKKEFSQEVKNLLLSMLYKIEVSYSDYKKTKVNVVEKEYYLKRIIENIKEEPYIESVQVKRKLPSTIIINVEERNRDFFISNYGSYIYIDKQGYILEISNEVEKLTEIKGFSTSTENLVPGNRISDDDLEKINTAQKIIETIKNNEIESEITGVDVSNTNDFCVIMQGEGKKIHLGNASNINDKILMLKEILTKEKGKTGEIFIENLEKVYFREASWIE